MSTHHKTSLYFRNVENEWESSVLLTFSWVEIQRDEKFYFKILKGSKSNLLRGSWDIKAFINAMLS